MNCQRTCWSHMHSADVKLHRKSDNLADYFIFLNTILHQNGSKFHTLKLILKTCNRFTYRLSTLNSLHVNEAHAAMRFLNFPILCYTSSLITTTSRLSLITAYQQDIQKGRFDCSPEPVACQCSAACHHDSGIQCLGDSLCCTHYQPSVFLSSSVHHMNNTDHVNVVDESTNCQLPYESRLKVDD